MWRVLGRGSAGLALAAAMAVRPASAATVSSAFFISKSENRNQVHYGVEVDEACRPVGTSPVRPYWRDLEKGPNVTSPVLSRELPAYGVAFQRILEPTEGRKIVELAVRGLPSRILHIETRSVDGKCTVETRAVIQKETVTLLEVFLKIGFFGVDYARFIGRSKTRGLVTEDVKS